MKIVKFMCLPTIIFLSTICKADDFINDSHMRVDIKNFYRKQDFFGKKTQEKGEQWVQSFTFYYRSGYTEGPIGFGIDGIGKYVQKLYGRKDKSTDLIAARRDGTIPNNFSRFGIAAKIKVSKTQIKIGEQLVSNPVVISELARSVPQTYGGVTVQSNDIKHLTISAGQLYRSAAKNDASMVRFKLNGYKATSDKFNYYGVDYDIPLSNTKLAVWYGQLTDIYKQKNLDIIQHNDLTSNLASVTTIRYWDGSEDGAALDGKLDNKTYSATFDLIYGFHKLRLGLQKVTGKDAWLKIADAGIVGILAQDSLMNASNNPNERSWQIRYDYDFKEMGMPGLKTMIRYIKGDQIKTRLADNQQEWSLDTSIDYVIQSGTFKDLSLALKYGTLHKTFNPSWNEIRFIASYSFSIF